MRWLSRLVTYAVFITVAVGAVLLLRAKIPSQKVGQSFKTWLLFRDGSRLAVGSPVVIAGVRVGDIADTSITGDFARVDLRLRDDIQLPIDTWATRRADSLFGDSYVELIPSGADEGASPTRLLISGEQLTHVEEGGSTDTVLRGIGRALPRIDSALEQSHDAVTDSRAWVNGTFADAMNGLQRFIATGRIENPIHRMDEAMTSVERYTDSAATAVADAGPGVFHTFDKIDRGIATARAKMTDVGDGLHTGLAKVRSGVDQIDPTIASLSDVVSAVNEGRGNDGKGKFGRLVNDPGLGTEIAEATDSLAEGAHSLVKLKSWLGLRIEYDAFTASTRFYATAELRARNDKFFLVELEKGPLGGLPSEQLSSTAGSSATTRTVQISDATRYTLEFGKQFGPLALRGGIKDSTFGVGADVYLMDNHLQLSVDAFGGFTDLPRVKLTAAYAVFRSVYLLAGIDDAFTSPGFLPIASAPGAPSVPTEFNSVRYGRDYFFGATLHFDDADLTKLIQVYGKMIAGLL